MAAWANALVTISGGRRRCLPMGLFGSWSAGLTPASPVALVPAVMVGGRPFPTALVLAGGAPLGLPGRRCSGSWVAGILAIFFPQTLYSPYGLGAKVSWG